MTSGVMRPASTAQILFQIKQLQVRQATRDEDFAGADVFLNSLPVAHRKRNIASTDFEGKVISIRKRDNSASEYDKIMAGTYLARFFLFEFTDAYILCLTDHIRWCLQQKVCTYQHNKTEPNAAYYIKVDDIPHLRIAK